jgi:hypothetical protein
MDEKLMAEARKHITEPDLVIDLYDLSIVWMSSKLMELLEYSEKDLGNITLIDLFGYDKERTRKAISEDFKEHGFRELIARTSKGTKFRLKAEFSNFEYNKGFYRVAKCLNHEKHVSGKK